MKKKYMPVILLLLTCSVGLIAQKDYRSGFIIASENDTIFGEIDYRANNRNYESCLFRNGEVETEYFPDQILSFGYTNDKFFTSQIIVGEFVEVLVTGDLCLYKSSEKYFVKREDEIYELESSKSIVFIDGNEVYKENNRWRGIIAYLTGDCLPISNNRISRLSFDEQSLTQIIVKYNSCKGVEYKEVKSDKAWTKMNFGVSMGITRTDIRIHQLISSYAYLNDVYSSINPSIGISMDVYLPRFTERFSLQGEMNYVKSSHSLFFQIDQTFTEYHDIFMDLNTIAVPLSIKYNFPEKKYGFYIQSGVEIDINVKSDTKLLRERVTGTVVTTYPEREFIVVSNSQVGFWGGIGLYRSFSRYGAGLSIRYFQMPNLERSNIVNADKSGFSLYLIFTFKK